MSARIKFLGSILSCSLTRQSRTILPASNSTTFVRTLVHLVPNTRTELNECCSPGAIVNTLPQVRHKFDSKRGRNKKQAEDDDDGEDELVEFKELQGGKDNKLTKVKVTSLRTDLLIKSGLGMARNKVEAAFYDSKIRLNGRKVAKKSAPIKQGDEIDVIRECSPINPENIVVSRLEVLSVTPNETDISIVLRRYKQLTIENYEAENVWRAHSPE